LAAGAALAVVAAAPAGAGWSPPQTLSRSHFFALPIGLGQTRGDALASWRWVDRPGVERVSMRPLGRPAPPARTLPAHTVAGPVAYGWNRIIVATAASGPDGARLLVRFGAANGRFGRDVLVARARSIYDVRLVANARGDAALGWLVSDGTPTVRAFASVRRRGAAFGRPILLGSGRIFRVSTAIGPDGAVLAAWSTRGGVVRTRTKSARDAAFAPVDLLRSHPAHLATPQVAFDGGGGAWVAWSAQDHSPSGVFGDAFVQIARRPPGATRFLPAQLLDRAAPSVHPLDVSLAIGADRIAIVAWMLRFVEADSGHAEVRVAQADALGTTRTDTLASFALPEVDGHAISAARRHPSSSMTPAAAVLWTQGAKSEERPAPLFASIREPVAPGALPGWGAPEIVTPSAGVFGLHAGYSGSGDSLVALYPRPLPSGRFVILQSTYR